MDKLEFTRFYNNLTPKDRKTLEEYVKNLMLIQSDTVKFSFRIGIILGTLLTLTIIYVSIII